MRIFGSCSPAVAVCLLAVSVGPAFAQTPLPSERLYGGVARGSENWTVPESSQVVGDSTSIRNVRDPEITPYLPDPAKANGTAVVYLPGGALRNLSMNQDQAAIIKRFTDRGIAVIVLKYRLAQETGARGAGPAGAPAGAGRGASAGPRGGGAPPMFARMEIRNGNANPAPDDEQLSMVLRLASADGQEALRRVRSHAVEWRLDPKRIGMLGVSAGGGVAFGTLLAGVPGATPDFIISLYGPSLQDVVVPANAPPLFMATESGHGPVTQGLAALLDLWKAAGKSAEFHSYEVPRITAPLWIDRALTWMEEQNVLLPASNSSPR